MIRIMVWRRSVGVCSAKSQPACPPGQVGLPHLRWLTLCLMLCLCSLTLWPTLAEAHKPSDSYLTLQAEGKEVAGQWDIALRDLDFALGLDANGDAAITWGEVRAKHGEIAAYALSRLQLSSRDQPCPTTVSAHLT